MLCSLLFQSAEDAAALCIICNTLSEIDSNCLSFHVIAAASSACSELCRAGNLVTGPVAFSPMSGPCQLLSSGHSLSHDANC